MMRLQPRKNAVIRKLCYAVLVISILLIVAEGAARLFESSFHPEKQKTTISPGWQTKFFRSLFDWNEPDPQLLWCFKPNLNNRLIHTNSAGLIGNEITRQKPDNTFRIMLLGDSSPVGIGLKNRSQSFGEILKRRLTLAVADSLNIELINASVTGYSSEQIARFIDLKGWSYHPDLIIVYCGNNDASISGSCTDRELLEHQHLTTLRRILSHSSFYRVLRSLLVNISDRPELLSSQLKARVSPERFGENLQHIAKSCKRYNCRMIILKPPAPYLWPAGLQFKVFRHVTGEDGHFILPEALSEQLGRKLEYCLDNIGQNKDKFADAVRLSAFRDTLPPDKAILFWRKELKKEKNNPVLLNNLGVAYWRFGDYAQADKLFLQARLRYMEDHKDSLTLLSISAGSPFLYNIGINLLSAVKSDTTAYQSKIALAQLYLDSALDADYFSLRIKNSYLKEIDKLKDIDNVTIIDLPEIFRKHGGDRLFVDHCHPTPEGHLLIANELLYLILNKYL